MNFPTIHLDRFSGAISDLPKGKRTIPDALRVLEKNGKVSVWDMDTAWLRSLIRDLEAQNLVKVKEQWYPWYVYRLTDAGKQVING